MKKRHLLLGMFALLSMVQARADVEIIETNFPDANFRSYLLSRYYGNDGVITDAEIATVTSIYVSSQNIASLKGIEFFTALTKLSCIGNPLTALDVSGCTALTTLECYNNQLTSLDVSGCTALTELRCYDNQLTVLDVSGCTALRELWCYNNQLTALDVSKNTALTRLYCYDNPLTTLDVSKNTALRELLCYNNQLTALDVSKNTALTNLDCNHNQLTALDVSGCVALGGLHCNGNQLTALDVTNNTALTYLRCYQNQIKGAAMDALVASLPTQTSASLYVIYYENEGNVMTTTQVAAAKAKGWQAYHCTGYYILPFVKEKWVEYAGSDPTAIEGVESDASASKNGSDVYFDLSGRRVMTPQKGVYVKNGRKVVVK